GELTTTPSGATPSDTAGITAATTTMAVGGSATFAATTTGCGTPQYAYWLEDPSGTWTLQRPFSFDPGWTLNSQGMVPGSYTVHVWANQYGYPTGALETYASSSVTFTGCSAATLTPASTTITPGPTMTLTAS